MNKLSVVLATYNEENNLRHCLDSIKDIADEIVVVDGRSSDKTVDIAKEFKAKVLITENHPIFHINKQQALELATYGWILQLDADERVSPELRIEIKQILNMSDKEMKDHQEGLKNKRLFFKHQQILEKRDGNIGTKEGEFNAFFVPRANYFLGKYLNFGGVYPDGVIRLIKRGKTYFPCKSVHEQIIVEGKVGWLQNDLIHMADPTFSRYLERNNRYIDLIVDELVKEKVGKDPLQFMSFCLIKPLWWFFLTQIRHKGILDGIQGVIFSFFSALRFPRAYIRYLQRRKSV